MSYVLYNHTLKTIPYKHDDFKVLANLAYIEFPDDWVIVVPCGHKTMFQPATNSDLQLIYKNLFGVEPVATLGRDGLINAIVKFCINAPASDIKFHHTEYQAKGLEPIREIDTITRFSFVPGSFVANKTPATGPNLASITAPATIASPGTQTPRQPQPLPLNGGIQNPSNPQPQRINSLAAEVVRLWKQNCELENKLTMSEWEVETLKTLENQGNAAWLINFEISKLKKSLQNN